jgi:hypothetical protein
VQAARAAIAGALAADTSFAMMPKFLADTFCPELVEHPDVLALVREPAVVDAIRSLLGPGAEWRADTAQIALRFPDRTRLDPVYGFHLDGYPSALNGVPAGTIFRHTILCGCYLTPLRGPDRGNFVVWPGSHRWFARWMREVDAPRVLRERGAEALLREIRAQVAAVGAPVQVEVEPGDVVLAHHLLAHGAAENLSLHVRETVYFRLLDARDHAQDPEPLLDADRFFDGLAKG